jgi:two-component system NarL family sensor kinase
VGRKAIGQRGKPGPVSVEEGRARELAVLNAIAEALNSSPNVRQALERTLALVAELLGLRTGWVWLLDPDTGQFYNAAVQDLPPYLQDPVQMTGRHCWCIGSFLAGELTPKNIDVMECSRLRPAVRAEATELTLGLAYHASIPLYFQDKPLGIMNVTGPAWRGLTDDELRLLSTIAYQVGIAVERARLAEASARLARTEERTRIAREIHDTLAQGLTAIGLHVEGALRHLESDPGVARERLERALATSRESLEEARRSVLDLRTAPLAGRPLVEALRALGRAFTSETGVRVQVRAADGDGPALPLRVEAELFRIAQEALANVRNHAGATEVEIALATGPDGVRLTIRDDGQGFDPAVPAAGRFGLLGMRERARRLGGRLRVTSRPGRGTTVVAQAPLPNEAEP